MGRLTEEEAAEQVRERLHAAKQPDWREAACKAAMGGRPLARAPAGGRSVGKGENITEEETAREGCSR